MRISVRNSDPGYFEGSYRCTVFLDGVKLDDCVTADEEEGLAICYDLSATRPGDPVPVLVERRGKVRIETRDEDGVCVLCGAGAGVMHRDDCRRQRPRYFAIGEREWKPGDSPVLPPIASLTGFQAGAIVADDPHADTIDPSAMKEMLRTMPDLAPEMRLPVGLGRIPLHGERSRCVIKPEHFVYGDGSPLSEADKRRLFGPRRSPVAAMMAARRAWAKRARKPKPFISEHDEGVHRAMSAMQRKGRANEL